MSNSNFNITKVVVDPVSQEISSLEVNGKPIETGSEPNLQVGQLTNLGPGIRGTLDPFEGYDGFSKVLYNTRVLNLQDKDLGFVGADPITITADTGYDGLASVSFWTESEIFSRTINTRRYIGDAGLSFATAQNLEHIWQYDATSGDWKAVEFTKVIDSENELVTVTITDSGYDFDWNVE